MNIYKEMIESMERITYAKQKQKEGNIDRLKKLGIEIYPLTDDEVKNMARETIVKGCYEEGCSKAYLKKAFGLSDEQLADILKIN